MRGGGCAGIDAHTQHCQAQVDGLCLVGAHPCSVQRRHVMGLAIDMLNRVRESRSSGCNLQSCALPSSDRGTTCGLTDSLGVGCRQTNGCSAQSRSILLAHSRQSPKAIQELVTTCTCGHGLLEALAAGKVHHVQAADVGLHGHIVSAGGVAGRDDGALGHRQQHQRVRAAGVRIQLREGVVPAGQGRTSRLGLTAGPMCRQMYQTGSFR